jgi:hypothetical protein
LRRNTQKVLNEKRLTNCLRLATTRLEEAQQEYIWAIASAHCEGLSMCRIGEAAGLSSSRVHQLLHSQEACRIPEWLSSLSDPSVNENEHLTNPESQLMVTLPALRAPLPRGDFRRSIFRLVACVYTVEKEGE